ncbi:MAG TPA: serine hydrolase [Leadbetterella sp.]|nr:serine hydrolase [Leadbetterella sp.]
MKLITLVILITMATLTNYATGQNTNSLPDLRKNILQLISKTEGSFGVAFKNLENGDTLFINKHEYFHAASTMKTPVMLEVFRQIEKKKFKLSDSILVKNEFKSILDNSIFSLSLGDDSDDILYKKLGQKVVLHDLIYDMMTVSSNLATNILIDLVDAKNVMKNLQNLGIKENLVLRGVEDKKAFEAGLNNRTTPFGLLQVFEHIATNQMKNKVMMDILFAQKFNEIIPAKLPKNTKVAHKTGSITGVQHDSGIVFLPDGRKYILILLSKNLKNIEEGVKTLSEISKVIFEHLN